MKAYQFIGILGLATTVIGVLSIMFNDKVTGLGLITAGLTDIGLSVSLAQGATTTPQ